MLSFGKDIIKYLERSLDEMDRFNFSKFSVKSKKDFMTEKEKMCLGVQREMLKELKDGYEYMADINVELSELGLEEDYKELEEYEKSIMGSGEL